MALLALLGFVGQSPSTTSAETPAATLSVNAPDAVRGGLLYQARFTIVAHQELQNATLVLNAKWIDGLTVNTIEPSPVNEASRDGKLALELGHLAAGARYVLYLDYQVNPTTRRLADAAGRARRRRAAGRLASPAHLRIWP